MEYHQYTIPENGIRILHKQVGHTKIAHCGFALDIGSRDETQHEQGLAHFWEHMAFKGTRKRKAFHILNRLDSVGGDLNAFTTKEKIFFHASVLDNYFEQAIELLTDITFHSTFPEREITKEKSVILEEMAMYRDTPSDAIYDEFDAVLFGDHPLGWLILGSSESVRRFTRQDFLHFVKGHLNTERLVLASVSAHPFEKVKKYAEKYLSEIPRQTPPLHRTPPPPFVAQDLHYQKPISQVHCLLGGRAYSRMHPNKMALALLTNFLGGPGMNTRLNLLLREKYGLVYSVDASYTAYNDTGNVSIGFATEPATWERTYQLLDKELKRYRQTPLGVRQLHQAKRQFMGQIAMSEESNSSYMLTLGRSILDEGYLPTLPEVFAEIERLTAKDLLEVMNEVFAQESLSRLVYTPETLEA